MKPTLKDAARALSKAVLAMRAAGYIRGDTAYDLADAAMKAAYKDARRVKKDPNVVIA